MYPDSPSLVGIVAIERRGLVLANGGLAVKGTGTTTDNGESGPPGAAEVTWDGRSPPPAWLDATRILGDPYAAKILIAASDREVPAGALVRALRIPPAACYRRLRFLLKAGLLTVREGPVARNGRAKQLYQSRVESVRVVFDEGHLTAEIRLKGSPSKEDGTPANVV